MNTFNLNYSQNYERINCKNQRIECCLVADAELQAEKGNKAAGTRARKASLELEKVLKEFRKVSLEESKK